MVKTLVRIHKVFNMKLKLIIAIIFYLFFGLFSFGQSTDKQVYKYEIGFTPMRIEQNSENINGFPEFKTLHGMYFIRNLKKGNAVEFKAEYGENAIIDDCKSCRDHYSGEGFMTEYNFSIGLRKTFFEEKQFWIRPYTQLSFNYSRIRYRGHFQGGIEGAGIRLDNSYFHMGPEWKFGVELYPKPRIPITLSHGYRLGWGERTNNLTRVSNRNIGSSIYMIELRIGYLF